MIGSLHLNYLWSLLKRKKKHCFSKIYFKPPRLNKCCDPDMTRKEQTYLIQEYRRVLVCTFMHTYEGEGRMNQYYSYGTTYRLNDFQCAALSAPLDFLSTICMPVILYFYGISFICSTLSPEYFISSRVGKRAFSLVIKRPRSEIKVHQFESWIQFVNSTFC